MHGLRRFPSVSLEFIEYTVIEQTQTLVSSRCRDLGGLPYVSPYADNYIKLNGNGIFSNFFRKQPVFPTVVQLNLATSVSALGLTELQPVLIKKCLDEISQIEQEASSVTTDIFQCLSQIEAELASTDDIKLQDIYNSLASVKHAT